MDLEPVRIKGGMSRAARRYFPKTSRSATGATLGKFMKSE
jgi:hypothetical protein